MRVAVDAWPAAKRPRTGTEFYTLNLILALATLDSVNDYTLFLNDEVPEEFGFLPPNFQPQLIPQGRLWTQTRLARELRRCKPDVFFSPANVIPFLHPPACVATIHDVAFRYFPECYSPVSRWYLDLTTRFALNRAVKVIAVSQATKDDLVQIYDADPSRIQVIHSGGPITSGQIPADDEVASALNRLGITRPYLLFLGRLETKKNVARIVRAFLRLKAQGIPHQLVLGGSPGVGFDEIKGLVDSSPVARDIIITGYVGEDRDRLYAGAEVFVFPSLYEGFGFPILEAASHGTPVVTSNRSSLPEVAGQAALLVDPEDVDEIAQGIFKLIDDQGLRSQLIERGYERLREFDWNGTAARVENLLDEVGRTAPH